MRYCKTNTSRSEVFRIVGRMALAEVAQVVRKVGSGIVVRQDVTVNPDHHGDVAKKSLVFNPFPQTLEDKVESQRRASDDRGRVAGIE